MSWLFSIKEELKDSFRFERELKWLVKKILEFMSFSNQWLMLMHQRSVITILNNLQPTF